MKQIKEMNGARRGSAINFMKGMKSITSIQGMEETNDPKGIKRKSKNNTF